MAVRAESIRRAVYIVKSYYTGASVRVVHPIEPEAFFVRDPAGRLGRSPDAAERGRIVRRKTGEIQRTVRVHHKRGRSA
ncbi:MAG: hypothetical protein LC751_10145 [Actinobacteria bacterium]|nr:hypothetical protein [Actinomycetota bacterium]